MQQDKAKIKLNDASRSMLACLWDRAQLSKKYSSLFYDEKAIELVEKIDYDDFAASDDGSLQGLEMSFFRRAHPLNLPEFGPLTLRAWQFDEKVKKYIAEHPRASVVNLGAGLDTTFYRVDNGLLHWYDLDLPEVIDVRRQLLPEPDRVTYIAKSIFDPNWCEGVTHTEEGVFIVAGGVFYWFEKAQVREFFSMLADNFDGAEIVFDVLLGSGGRVDLWTDTLPPEQRDAMKTALAGVIKEWWEKAPQDQKRRLNDTIAALELQKKPKGKTWSDLEAWWNQLSEAEKAEVWRGLRQIAHIGADAWALDDAHEIEKWDRRITVIDQLPLFKGIPRDPLDADMRRFMDYSDEQGSSYIIHLRV
ncbi:MAG: class I SAM-dependent methyltransferase [Halobacteriota archaeon]